MAKKKKKWYVVWVGKTPGIYTEWPLAQQQVSGVEGARYKSFGNLMEAKEAFAKPWQEFYDAATGRSKAKANRIIPAELLDIIEANSIAVDAACSGNPGIMEYRGVWTLAPEVEVFHSPKFDPGTNNIGEFLAIVHALALFSKEKPDLTIYTDSRIAMGWIRRKMCRSKLPKTAKSAQLWRVIHRGEQWLRANSFSNPIVKWETKEWGEIPADFGRK